VLADLEARLDDELSEFPARVAPWRRGETVALLAMGAAHHSTRALACVLRSGGLRALDMPASEIGEADAAAIGDHALVVTESGRSPEPIEAASRFPRGRRLVITNDVDAPVRLVADAMIGLGGFADSRAYTAGFTSLLAAYDRLVRALGSAPPAERSIATAVAEAQETFIEPATRFADALALASSVDVVGSGMSVSSAAEIALLVRECRRIPVAAFETHQYLHGPMESVRSGTIVIIVGDGRERAIPASLKSSGSRFLVIGSATADGTPHFDIGRRTGFARVAVEAVAGQRLIAATARRLPFTIDEFVHSQTDTKV
jgi:fructoselysine-6-P-deglycase FrlB-like protein